MKNIEEEKVPLAQKEAKKEGNGLFGYFFKKESSNDLMKSEMIEEDLNEGDDNRASNKMNNYNPLNKR